MAVDEKIIERIRKLLALSSSPNQHEAELAMSKVSELMTAHQLEMADVLIKSVDTDSVQFSETIKVSETYRSFVLDIGRAAAYLFDCNVCNAGEYGAIQFIGFAEDITYAKAMFDYLFSSWLSIVKTDTKTWINEEFHHKPRQYEVKSFKIGHGQGFATQVKNRAYRLMQERKEKVKTASSGTALVIVKETRVKSFFDDNTVTPKNWRPYKEQDLGKDIGSLRGKEIPLGGAIDERKKIGNV